MKLPKYLTTVTPLSKALAIILFITFPIIGFLIGIQYEKVNSQNNTVLFKQKNNLTSSQSTGKNNQLSQAGINSNILTIKEIDIKANWQEDGLEFNAVKTYFTPDIADLGSFRNNNDIKNKFFIVVQVEVRNITTEANGIKEVRGYQYFRIRKDGKDTAPLADSVIFLHSQEDGTLYVVIPVDRQETIFKLLLGSIARPRVIDLDFGSKQVNSLKGVFLFKEGFSTEYKQ